MRLVIQRVKKAAVTVDALGVVGSIDRGLVILVGVTHDDTEEQARWLAHKAAGLRIFEDSDGKFNISLHEMGGAALVISQFIHPLSRIKKLNHACPVIGQRMMDRLTAQCLEKLLVRRLR